MKKHLLKTLCVLLLVPALLSGCWQEEFSDPESQELPQPEESEVTESRVISPTHRTSLWTLSPAPTGCSRWSPL